MSYLLLLLLLIKICIFLIDLDHVFKVCTGCVFKSSNECLGYVISEATLVAAAKVEVSPSKVSTALSLGQVV